MTPDERQNLKALLVATSMYYGQQLPDSVLSLYVEDLADLDFQLVAKNIAEVRRDPKTTRCPLPAIIRARVQPQTDPESEAIEAVGRIISAISRIGPYRSTEAKLAIGELGWFVVQREGGWENVCQVLTEDNMGTLKAQWRQAALAYQKRAKAGMTEAPTLAGPDHGRIANMSKLLPEMPK